MGEMKFPIEVGKIERHPIYRNINKPDSLFNECGQLVSVRPCDEKYAKKTYLGILLGDLPLDIYCGYNKETKVLKFFAHKNPAIFVPELGEIIWGCESWWGAIKTEKDLHLITDKDIQETWYVKLLKELAEKRAQSVAQNNGGSNAKA